MVTPSDPRMPKGVGTFLRDTRKVCFGDLHLQRFCVVVRTGHLLGPTGRTSLTGQKLPRVGREP